MHIFWQVKFLGSTFRLLPEARAMAKFLPLDTISLRYVAWEMLVEVRSQYPTHSQLIFCLSPCLVFDSCLCQLKCHLSCSMQSDATHKIHYPKLYEQLLIHIGMTAIWNFIMKV